MNPPLDTCPSEFDPEILLTEDVAPVIRRIIDELNRSLENVNKYGQMHTGALEFFSERTGINARTVNRVMSGESPTISLDLADRILLGFGLNVSFELPADAFYKKSELREARRIELEMLLQCARSRGEFVPPKEGSQRKAWTTQYRRRLVREMQAA